MISIRFEFYSFHSIYEYLKICFFSNCFILPQRQFGRIVAKYDSNYKVRHFSCWNQVLCMVFGLLSNHESCRDLIITINAHSRKRYHIGFSKSIPKTNIARANEQRTYFMCGGVFQVICCRGKEYLPVR